MLKSLLANYSKKAVKKWKYCLLAPILLEKWRNLTWLHIVPKFKLNHLRKIFTWFKMVMLTPKLCIEIYMLNRFNNVIFCKIIKVRLFFKNSFQNLFGKVICLFSKVIFSVFCLYLNVTNIENTFHPLNLS